MTLRQHHARPSVAATAAALILALLSTVFVGLPAQAADSPTVTVSKTEDLNGDGEIITVTGRGFVPDVDGGPAGTRPPLAGQFVGAYVVFGKFADDWKPSDGADGASRANSDGTHWALPESSHAAVGGPASGAIPLSADGTFEATFEVSDFDPEAAGNYGIYTYAGSGAKYAPFETATPLTFAEPEPEPEPSVEPSVEPSAEPTPEPAPSAPSVLVSKTEGLNSEGETVTVTGRGFVPDVDGGPAGTRPPLAGQFVGAYVVFGKFADDWKPSDGADGASRANSDGTHWALPESSHAAVGGPASGAIPLSADGTFEATFEVSDFDPEAAGNYGIYTYAGSGVKYAGFETYTPLTFTDTESGLPVGSIEVTPTVDLDPAGDTVTVTGSRFVPAADGSTDGTHFPTPAGTFGGAYVAFAKYPDSWKPSEGVESSERDNIAEKWMVSQATYNQLASTMPSILPRLAPISDAGTFTIDFDVAVSETDATTGNYGIYTYGGGSSGYAGFETYTPLTFAGENDNGGEDDGDDGNPGTTPEPETPVGDLVWGIKSSFLNYIKNDVPDGVITTKGVTDNGRVFGFTQSGGNADPVAGTGTAKYSGSVNFKGHNEVLNVTIANPHVAFTSTSTAKLMIDTGGSRIEFATLDLPVGKTKDGATTFTQATTKLTAAGAKVLEQYPAGTVLDPITFTVGSGSGSEEVPVDQDGTGNNSGGGQGNGSSGSGTNTPPLLLLPPAKGVTGSLTWGVDSGFRNYVTGPIAEGTISVQGASASGGQFTFGQSGGNLNATAGTGTANYSGAVTFKGHRDVLNLQFANPQVRMTGTSSAVLSVSVNGSRVNFATLNLGAANKSAVGNGVRFTNAPATLTAAGAGVFDVGDYRAGRTLAPVSFTFGDPAPAGGGSFQTVASAVQNDSGIPGTPPATTGIDIDDETLRRLLAGEVVTLEVPGFEPNEEGIKVVIYSDPIVLANDVSADADGVASWTGSLPASLTGEHTLTFQGSSNYGIVLDIPDRALMCVVDSPQLSWGFKEAFRAYFESTIANGTWELDGVTQDGPNFVWTGGEGSINTDPLVGSINHTGSIRMLAHGGALDTTIANPVVEISADGAYLLLDVVGETQDGQAVEQTAIRFAELDMEAAEISEDGTTVTIADIPAVLTEQGADAFGTYPAGDSMDPVTFELTSADDCVLALAGVEAEPMEEPTEEPATDATPVAEEAPAEDSNGIPWWVWMVVALVLAAGAAVAAVINRRKQDD